MYRESASEVRSAQSRFCLNISVNHESSADASLANLCGGHCFAQPSGSPLALVVNVSQERRKFPMKRTLGPSPQGSCGTRGGEPKSNLGFAWKDLAPSVLFPRISPDTRQPPFSHLVCTPQPLHGTDDCGLATGCEGRSRGQEASPSTDPPDPPGSEVGNFNPFLQRENPGDLHRTASRASDLVARTVGDPVPPQRLQISRSREEQSPDSGRKGASRNKPRQTINPTHDLL